MYWIYNEPVWLIGSLFPVFFLFFSSLIVFIFRAFVNPWIHRSNISNDAIGLALNACFVLLALLLGLITVATYQNYSDICGTVDQEAAALGEFSMDVQALPSPFRERVLTLTVDYMRATIEHDWPAQQNGITPVEGTDDIQKLSRLLMSFSPQDDRENDVFRTSLGAFDRIIMARDVRLSNVTLGLPAVLWWTLGLCTLLNILISGMQALEVHVHYILCGMIAIMLGLVIFLTAELDNPFRGEVSVSPSSIALALQNISQITPGPMKEEAGGV